MSMALLAAGFLLQSACVRAESFEVVNYAPPRGWPVKNAQDGKAYERPDGNGMILFYASRFDNPEVAFAVTWRELVERVAPGPPPTPQIGRQGDFTVAIGARHARSNDKAVAVSLVTIAGRWLGPNRFIGGRRVSIVGVTQGDEALRELTAFFDTVALRPPEPAPDPLPSDLIGRWWKDAGNHYYWYEFADKDVYSYETPFQERRTGTFRVQGNRITLTDSTGNATSRIFHFECVGGKVRLELSGEAGYWSVHRSC
jgi:hypothetical protein